MPKKFVGENSKAVAARARKDAVKETETVRKKQQVEDDMWRDEDKNSTKKLQKKEELEKRKQEQLLKKAEVKAMLEKEMDSIKKPTKVAPPLKVTRAQIDAGKVVVVGKKEEKKVETHLDLPVEENINRMQVEGLEARSITEAITILSVADDTVVDKHPEKRMKAAYNAYEEKRLIELKVEHPSLRQSQLKQMIFKEWQKSPENPLNKA